MILTAKEAKERQVNNPDKLLQLNEIMTAIENQVNDTQSETMAIHWYNERLTMFTINALKELGYDIDDFSNQKDGIGYRISWEKA